MLATVKKSSIAIMVIISVATLSLLMVVLPTKAYAETVPYEVGDTGPAGGIIFWVDGSNCLEVSPSNLSDDSPWSNITDALAGASGTAIGTGQANTTAIIGQSGHISSAAKLCDDFVLNNYDDWFLPSINELQNIWVNLHLQSIGNFNNEYYLSSTEASATEARIFKFSGWVGSIPKSGSHVPYQVRAIRAFTGMKEIGSSKEDEIVVEPIVRSNPMTCYQVWINEYNNFEFVFWWAYKNNNWVQIFDKSGNLVWETDFLKDEPNFEVDLPDGMYTVKTFHEAGHILQEFVIGKP